MLSKKDKQEIRNIIKEELADALTRKINIERGPEKQGDPEKVIKEEEWSFVDFWFGYAPKIEAALQGTHADVNKCTNKTAECVNQLGHLTNNIEVVNSILVSNEQSMKKIAHFGGWIEDAQEEVLAGDGSKKLITIVETKNESNS